MQITITTGIGAGPTMLAAFDAALYNAGVQNYNLIALSSVIPPNSCIVRSAFTTPTDEYGHRLYVVMSRCNAQRPGQAAWAGIGWVQEPSDGRGLFVELHGESELSVQVAINKTLTAMMIQRGHTYGSIQSAIVGSICYDQPVCALVIAVYESQGWAAN